jgi:hypothetical protein
VERFRPRPIALVTTDEQAAAALKALDESGYVPSQGEVTVIRLVGLKV